MKRSLRRAVPMLGLVLPALLAPALVSAQAQPKGQPKAQGPVCDVDQNKPASLTKAAFTLARIPALQADTAARGKAARDVVKSVAEDAAAAKANPVGHAYTLAQAYAWAALDPAVAMHASRGTFGLGGDAAATIDVLAQVDSLLKVVQTAKPGCAESVTQYRQVAWQGIMNSSLQSLNAQKMDSAAAYAERSLRVYEGSYLPYYVLSVTAQQKGDAAKAATYWPRILELTATDTASSAVEIRSNTMFNMAAGAATAADQAKGAEQQAKAREAVTAIQAFLKAFPNHADAGRLQPVLARMLTLTGDKSAVSSVYSDMLANPAKYNDLDLTQGGVIASQAGNHADAAKLFEAAAAKNPYQRDALNNLAATYLTLKQFDKMLPPARKLIELDPANPDNYAFLSLAYNGLANAAKTPALKRAMTDTAVQFYQKSESTPLKVSFTGFTRGEQRTVLEFQVQNLKKDDVATTRPAGRPAVSKDRPAAAKPAAAAGAPKTYVFSFEFLDQNGQVVDTQQVSVGPVAPGASQASKVEVAKAGIVGFRYKVQS